MTERTCTGVQPMLGRLLPPSIAYGAESISLVFAAKPVELRKPLRDRRLLDAGLLPPRDASLPPT